ncbi:MAG: endonuclease MutS2 [Ruminococcaceae bacterium]|nr:endonuclease MutS2 [Oscillospiraceae bacterium]
MLYTQKSLAMLEYDKVIAMLAERALTEGARDMALRLVPSNAEKTVIKKQRITADARRLVDAKGYPSFGGVKNISEILGRAKRGALLQPLELLEIADLLRVSRGLSDYIKTDKPFETVLDETFLLIAINRHLEDRITRTVVSEDFIADEASAELADIRRKIRSANNRIKDTLQKFISGGYGKLLQENIVTMRNDRYVVPVKIEHKNEIKGLVHDTSASGQTVFIEPVSVVEANNELKILKGKEEREIEKILYELSSMCAENADMLSSNYYLVTELAFAFTCASLAEHMKANAITHEYEKKFNLKRAIHPLLDAKTAVPINVHIGDRFDTLVITGPNTGGKTVTLKTIGLFALMYQSGLQIPAAPNSTMCVFNEILVDIGDEQSIEQSLSTFSAHMVNIVEILGKTTNRSLVLLDELGAGTDPVEGAALAVSILEEIRAAGALSAATTHYAELKAYAIDTEGVTNASCEFDIETLRPTYKLIIGTPGKSNAFAISKRLGLPERIIEKANTYISGDSKRFENIIEKLEADRIAMEKAREEAERMRIEYEAFKKKAEADIEKARKEAEREKDRAQNQAKRIIQSARESSEYVLKEISDLKKKKAEEVKKEELEKAKQSIRAELRRNSGEYDPIEDLTDKDYVLPRALVKGDTVLIMSIGQTGTVISPPDKNGMVRVQAGRIATRTEVANLKLIEQPSAATKKNKEKTAYRNAVVKSFSPELDIRGMYGDDGCFMLDKYLDDAMLAGIHTVRIIHGKGTGALKNAIWQYLRNDKRVSSYRLGVFGEGDGGVTIVEIK